MPVYPELGRLRQKDREFKASIGYIIIISSQPTWSLNFETLLETVKKECQKKKNKEKKMSLLCKVKIALTYPLNLVLTL